MNPANPARPPIPATCEHRPTIGGRVIPYANVQLADGGVDFRARHETRLQRCWTEGICQVCARPLTRPMVLFGGPDQIKALQFDEPPMHPECAVYATHACPMLAGRATHFATRDALVNGHRGHVCPDPGCDCGGWVPTPDYNPAHSDAVRPAHPWYALYVSGFTLAVSPDRPNLIHSCIVARAQILTIRNVSKPGFGHAWKRTTLTEIAAEATAHA